MNKSPICPECEKEFTPAVAWQKYCTRQHGMKAYNRKHYYMKKQWADPGYVRSRAVSKVQAAIRSGKLVRQPCEVCKDTDRIEGHHEDYTKPLEVRWLCGIHHIDRHRELRRLGIKIPTHKPK